MRWNRFKKAAPEAGAVRVKTRFAVLPTVVNDSVVWLEPYQIYETYKHKSHFIIAWVEISRNTVDWFDA